MRILGKSSVFSIAFLIVVPLSAVSQECTDYSVPGDYSPAEEFVAGGWHWDDPWLNGFDVFGDYVAISASSFSGTRQIIEFYSVVSADPSTPVFSAPCGDMDVPKGKLGRGDGSIATYKYRVEAGHGSYDSWNMVTDLAAPGFPTGRLGREGWTFVFGSMAFVEAYWTVYLYDLTTITDPVERGSFAAGSDVKDLGFVNGHLIVYTEALELLVCDVADPDLPVLRSTVSLPATAESMASGPDYVVMSCGAEGIWRIGLTDPYAPDIDEEPTVLSGVAKYGVISHPVGYFSCEDYGLVAVDMSGSTPVVLPGRVVVECSDLDIGSTGVYGGPKLVGWTLESLWRLPLHCDDPLDSETKSLGDIKAMFR